MGIGRFLGLWLRHSATGSEEDLELGFKF